MFSEHQCFHPTEKQKILLACTHDSNCFSRWYAFDKGFLPKAHFTFSPSIISVIKFYKLVDRIMTGIGFCFVLFCFVLFCFVFPTRREILNGLFLAFRNKICPLKGGKHYFIIVLTKILTNFLAWWLYFGLIWKFGGSLALFDKVSHQTEQWTLKEGRTEVWSHKIRFSDFHCSCLHFAFTACENASHLETRLSQHMQSPIPYSYLSPARYLYWRRYSELWYLLSCFPHYFHASVHNFRVPDPLLWVENVTPEKRKAKTGQMEPM